MSMKLPGNPNAGIFKQRIQLILQLFRWANLQTHCAFIRELHSCVLHLTVHNGRNKLLLTTYGENYYHLLNDAATMLRELDVIHPAVRILIMATQQQQQEWGLLQPGYDSSR